MRKVTTPTPAAASPRGSRAASDRDSDEEESGGAARRLSAVSRSSSGAGGAGGGGGGGGTMRYSWNDDPDKTHALIRLITEAFAQKPRDKRYVRASEWEVVLDAFNREASAPCETVKILHNRLAILRTQCRDYHKVLKAQHAGLLASDDAWLAFAKANPSLRKFRKRPFEFYEEMAACLRAMNESVDVDEGEEDEEDGEDEDGDEDEDVAANGHAANGDRRRSSLAADASPLLALNRQRQRELKQSQAANSRSVRRRVGGKSGPSAAAASEPGGIVSISHYPAALRHLAKLELPMADRVAAKRFLVDDGNSQAFIYMDDDERRFFLKKYCLDRRGSDAPSTTPASPPPQQGQQEKETPREPEREAGGGEEEKDQGRAEPLT